jgi:hypothetical protein
MDGLSTSASYKIHYGIVTDSVIITGTDKYSVELGGIIEKRME